MRFHFRKKKENENIEQADARAAVMDLVFANSKEEIREVFARSGSLLTTELADQVLEQLIKEAHGDKQLEAHLRERLIEIRAARSRSAGAPLIPRDRIIEILQSAESEKRFNALIQKHPEAQKFWDELIQERANASKYITNIKKFLFLETYPEQKLYLKKHPKVLSYTSLAWLEMQLLEPGLDSAYGAFYGFHAALLDDVRHSDIDTAFERYVNLSSPWDVFERRRLLTSAKHLPTLEKHSTLPSFQPHVFLISQEDDEDAWIRRIESELQRNCMFVTTIAQSDAVVVIVGQHFGKRQKSPKDKETAQDLSVFTKLRHALAIGKTIIPIIIGGIPILDNLSLPSDVRKLVSRQAVVVDSGSAVQSIITQVLRGVLLGKSNETEDEVVREAVFISYRRADSQIWAQRLARTLISRMGNDLVYFDIARTRPGQDFELQIERAISGCSDFIVVIGKRFFEIGSKGIRRIDQPEDYVRKEISTALLRKKRVHIVLVDNAKMPQFNEMPDAISQLSRTKSIFRGHSDEDIQRIVDRILAGRFPDKYNLGHGIEVPDYGRKSRAVTASMVSELNELDWKVVDKGRRSGRDDYVLYKSEFSQYRLRVTQGVLLLQERRRSVLRLGLYHWITRRSWWNIPDMLRLPDDIVEAALNPERFIKNRKKLAL